MQRSYSVSQMEKRYKQGAGDKPAPLLLQRVDELDGSHESLFEEAPFSYDFFTTFRNRKSGKNIPKTAKAGSINKEKAA